MIASAAACSGVEVEHDLVVRVRKHLVEKAAEIGFGGLGRYGKPVYLETFVKVDKDWRSSKRELDNFGYNPE